MKHFLPNYRQCREICDANDNFIFFEIKHKVDDYLISVFSYRLAMPEIFTNPIKDKPEITGFELRGLVFVWHRDGSLYKRYLLMDKFFNLNQSKCSAYSLMKKETIKEIINKEDGSIISFIKLPNGKIKGRSKTSFVSDQAIEAEKIYNVNQSIKKLVDYCLDNEIVPIFELVGPKNRVVLKYNKTNLILIKLRNNLTGEYLLINNLPSEIIENVIVVKTFNDLTLDELIDKSEVDTGYEGFVITFESGKMIKIKLKEYCDLHNLYTEYVNRENTIISLIIEDKIDDVLCQLDEEDERKELINGIINTINHFIVKEKHEIESLLKTFNGDIKKYVSKISKNKHFACCMLQINRHYRINSLIIELANKIECFSKFTEYTLEYKDMYFAEIMKRFTIVCIKNDDPRKEYVNELVSMIDEGINNAAITHIRQSINKYNDLFIGEDDIIDIIKRKILNDTSRLEEAKTWINNNK